MFSLDNVGTDYEKIRGGDWDTVANNVRRFIDLTAKGGREVLVSANVVHSPSNPVDRSAIIASLAKLGVPRVDITSCSMFHSNVGRRTAPCREWYRILIVLVDGRVTPCCVDYDGELIVGSVHEEPDLRKLFNNQRMRKLRRDMLDPDTMPATCQSCLEWCGKYSVPKFS